MPTTSRTPRMPRAPRKARAAALVASPTPVPPSDETPSSRPSCTSCGHYVMSAPLVMLLCLTTIVFFLMLAPLFVPVRAWFTGQTKMMMCADVIKKAVQNAVPPVVTTPTGSTGAETVCTANYSPVCGEIEVQCIKAPCPPIRETYSNDCEARKVGAKIVQQGACIPSVAEQVTVSSLVSGQKIVSPVLISGDAFGGWYFEGVFPIAITDLNGVVLGEGAAKTSADWAAAALVGERIPFSAKISFKKGTAKQGYVVIKQDNPSGLPENDHEMKIPVTF